MTQKRTCLEENFHAIAAILRDFTLDRVQVSYAGSGDEGDIYSVSVFRDGVQNVVDVRALPRVTLQAETFVLKDGVQQKERRTFDMEFRSALTDVLDCALTEADHSGWENEAGSDGDLTIYANGKAVLEHTDLFDDEEQRERSKETTDYDLQSNNKVSALLQVLLPVIARSAESVTVTYSGAGDDGNHFSIRVAGDNSMLAERVTVPQFRQVYNPSKNEFEYEKREFTLTVESAIGDLTDYAIDEAGHRGYENNEGGGGVFVINADGTARLTHADNYVGESKTTDSWNGEDSQQ